MIKGFAAKDTATLFAGRCPRRWLPIRAQAERELAMLQAARTLEFLRSPPGNRLEALQGDRLGQHCIGIHGRINDRWRICFRWSNGDALDVEIADYH